MKVIFIVISLLYSTSPAWADSVTVTKSDPATTPDAAEFADCLTPNTATPDSLKKHLPDPFCCTSASPTERSVCLSASVKEIKNYLTLLDEIIATIKKRVSERGEGRMSESQWRHEERTSELTHGIIEPVRLEESPFVVRNNISRIRTYFKEYQQKIDQLKLK